MHVQLFHCKRASVINTSRNVVTIRHTSCIRFESTNRDDLSFSTTALNMIKVIV